MLEYISFYYSIMGPYILFVVLFWFLCGLIGGYSVNKEMYKIMGEYIGLSWGDIKWITKMSVFGPYQLDPLSQEIKDRMKNVSRN